MQVCRAGYIPCPTCQNTLPKVLTTGSYFVTCNHRLPDPSARGLEKRTIRCGQAIHVVAIEGVAYVTPVPGMNFQHWRRNYPRVEAVYETLEIIVARSDTPAPAVPMFPCKGCGRTFSIFDLYAGECAACVPAKKVPA